jgi:hypothetical protein
MKWKPEPGEWRDGAYQLPGLGLRKGKLEKRTKEDITHIGLHHTGVGVLSRFEREKDKRGWHEPLDSANFIYTRIMPSSGHYVVGYRGEIVQYVPDLWSAWHMGYGNKRQRSRRGEWFAKWRYSRKAKDEIPLWLTYPKYQWWKKRWYDTKGYTSPTQWFPDLNTNFNSIGIELLAVPHREPFHEAQLNGLHDLLTAICGDYGIPMTKDHVLTHSDVCPLARTTKSGKPWDPPPEKIDPFLTDLFSQ